MHEEAARQLDALGITGAASDLPEPGLRHPPAR
jgi:hypothetical protein